MLEQFARLHHKSQEEEKKETCHDRSYRLINEYVSTELICKAPLVIFCTILVRPETGEIKDGEKQGCKDEHHD